MITITYKQGTEFYVNECDYNRGLELLKNNDILVLQHMCECVVDPQGKVLKIGSKVKNMKDTEISRLTKDVTYTIDENDFVAYVDRDYVEYIKSLSTRFMESLLHMSKVFISKGKVIKNIYIVHDVETIDSLAGVLDLVKVTPNNMETKEVLYNGIINLIKVTKGGKVSYLSEIDENYDEKQVIETVEHLYNSGVTKFETEDFEATDIHDFLKGELEIDSLTVKTDSVIKLFEEFNQLLKDDLEKVDKTSKFGALDIESKLNMLFELLQEIKNK